MRKTVLVVAALALVILAGTLTINVRTAAAQDSLYTRLGGQPAIQAVVDQFLKNVAADNRINHYFAKVDLANLNKLLVEQICQGTGGPCTYTGRSMKDTHAGLGIDDADFNALVEDLVASLNTLKVPAKEQADLLAILGPMKADIVTAPAAALPTTGGSFDFGGMLALAAVFGVGLFGAGLVLRKRAAEMQ